MSRYAAFLRGMNVGGHRLTHDELLACFVEMGFRDVAGFRAIAAKQPFEAEHVAASVGKLHVAPLAVPPSARVRAEARDGSDLAQGG